MKSRSDFENRLGIVDPAFLHATVMSEFWLRKVVSNLQGGVVGPDRTYSMELAGPHWLASLAGPPLYWPARWAALAYLPKREGSSSFVIRVELRPTERPCRQHCHHIFLFSF